MKIGTDGVLLGAIASGFPCTRVLDIGTGCGLIALMLAQETKAIITGIDLDPDAIERASLNAGATPWSKNVHFICSPFQRFARDASESFDLIVCNPPFFVNSLVSADAKRSTSRHAHTLPLAELFDGVNKLLKAGGTFVIILPHNQKEEAVSSAARYQLNIQACWDISPKPGRKPHRAVLAFGYEIHRPAYHFLTVETEERHAYSDAYRQLTGAFYPAF